MRFSSTLALGLSCLASAAVIQKEAVESVALQSRASYDGYLSVAYFVNWELSIKAIYDRNHQPQNLLAEQFTHILYSFANIRASGEVYLSDPWSDVQKLFPGDVQEGGNNMYGCLKQMYLHKKKHRKMKTLLSIGGWTYSKNFPVPASTAAGRAQFAKTSVAILKQHGFDGIDVDWEYPVDETEANNFVLLLQAVRDELDAYTKEVGDGYHYLLTIASPAGPHHYNKLKFKEMDALLDFWNIMTYDFAGSWDTTSGHMSNIYPSTDLPSSTPFSSEKALTDYIAYGIDPKKIILGMPLYGRAFEKTEGIGQNFTGIGPGTWEPGVYDYKVLPQAGAKVTEDKTLGASYSYDAAKKFLISYDTPAIAKQKTEYLMSKKLGGAMWWETSSDKTGSLSLVGTVLSTLGGQAVLDKSQNQLNYPKTTYANLKKGM
ncbi:Endochitinase 1 [Myotisia sp. PD_48]|nr:Endochitinase 1 [Myotisia sp. PD_48]